MYAQRKSIENLHIVRERDRERVRELFAVLAIGVPLGLFLLLFTWQNLEVIRLGREATELTRTRELLEERNKTLEIEIQKLTSLPVVETQATRLGFEPVDSSRVVEVRAPQAESAADEARGRP